MHASFKVAGAVLMAAVALCGCEKGPAEWFDGDGGHGHGRYAGIGIYNPGAPWQRMAAAQLAKETPAARTVDDQAIIVVVDGATGEVRGCGDMTGYCIGMNPWKARLTAGQLAPVVLTSHARSIGEDATAASSAAAPDSAPASR